MAFLEVPNRYLAGVAEVALKAHISDKTQWKTMLSQPEQSRDLIKQFNALKAYLPDEVQPYVIDELQVEELNFPYTPDGQLGVRQSLSENEPLKGKLKGIKGQYLIFDDYSIFNVRSSEGYVVAFNVR